jgi:hypothetical protein
VAAAAVVVAVVEVAVVEAVVEVAENSMAMAKE